MCNIRSNLEKYGISSVSRVNRKEFAKKKFESDDEVKEEQNSKPQANVKADKNSKHKIMVQIVINVINT